MLRQALKKNFRKTDFCQLSSKISNLKIVGLSNLGQGFGFLEQNSPSISNINSSNSSNSNILKNFSLKKEKKKIFVNKTVAGDEIEAQIVKENNKFIIANLIKINHQSTNRRESPCRFFKNCGGCQLQHLKLDFYQNFKQKIITDLLLLNEINFNQKIEWSFISEGSRRKVNLQVDINHNLGFFRESSNDVVKIDNCLILKNEISALILPLQNLLKSLIQLFSSNKKDKNNFRINQITITKFDNGLAIIFENNQHLSLEINDLLINFAKQNNIINLSYKIKDNLHLIYQSQPPQIFFGDIKLNLKSDVFLQATKQASDIIIKIVTNEVNQILFYNSSGLKLDQTLNIADLYCGIGTYSFGVLSQNKIDNKKIKIDAFEGDLTMVDLLNQNATNNQLGNNLKGFDRDLVKNPVLTKDLKKYQLAIINPPRNGAGKQIEQLAKSQIRQIIYISCNPQSFVIEAKMLLQNGYKLSKIRFIDQFVYSYHIELLAVFNLA